MYLHTVGCCQTVNENTPPRLTPAMEIGAREQAHGKQWNEKWRRVRVKTNERAVLKWNEHKNTTSKSKSKNTTQQTDERKKIGKAKTKYKTFAQCCCETTESRIFIFPMWEFPHLYAPRTYEWNCCRTSHITSHHLSFPFFSRIYTYTRFFSVATAAGCYFFFLFFFSFSIYFCLAFCDVAFVCFFVLLVISSQNIDTTTLHVPHFDGAVIISMLGVDVVSCSSLTELFMTLSLFSHSSSPLSLSLTLRQNFFHTFSNRWQNTTAK